MAIKSEQFGRVYITKSEDEMLSSACFSNLDLKWYDLSGDLHPKLNDFANSNISLGFTINNMNKSGKLEEFQGKFHIPLKIGEIGVPDTELLAELPQLEKKHAKELKIIYGENDPKLKVLGKTQTAAMFLLMTPGNKFFRENNFLMYLSLLVMLDDFLDDHKSDVSKFAHGLEYKRLTSVLEPGLQAYKNGEVAKAPSTLDLMTSADMNTLSFSMATLVDFQQLYGSYFKVNQMIFTEANKLGPSSDIQPFFKSLLESYEALTLQHSAEWKKGEYPSMKLAQVELCKITISSIMAGEAIALLKGIQLSETIRSSFLFKWFLNQAATHAGKANDLISYHKESIEEDDCNNEVYILHVINNWPLEKALTKVLDDANQAILGLNDAAKLLLEIHDDDENLEKYIQVVKEVICGHLQWMAYISRYHSNLVYDCYIEENE